MRKTYVQSLLYIRHAKQLLRTQTPSKCLEKATKRKMRTMKIMNPLHPWMTLMVRSSLSHMHDFMTAS